MIIQQRDDDFHLFSFRFIIMNVLEFNQQFFFRRSDRRENDSSENDRRESDIRRNDDVRIIHFVA